MRTLKKFVYRLAASLPALIFSVGLSACDAIPYEFSGNTYTKEITVIHDGGKETTEYDSSQEETVSAAPAESAETEMSADQSEKENGQITVTMLDVGNGLSILIDADEHYMLVDGGGRDTSSFVVAYLKNHEITSLDYMIATHYDEDHIAGLIGVLNTTDVGQVIRPYYEADTKIYASFMDKLSENGAETVYPSVGDIFTLGGACFTVLAPAVFDEMYENNNSVAVRLTYGSFSCIITGDAEFESEETMVNTFGSSLKSDLYVAGHHGSGNASSEVFIKAVQPTYTFISCGADNKYGHPAEETMIRLKNAGTSVFRTDLQGTVTAVSDGAALTFDQQPCNDFTPGTEITDP